MPIPAILESDTEILLADGFDDCLIGLATRFGGLYVAAYDVNKMLAQMVGGGMTMDEAREFYEFNILGAWVGESTPVFVEGIGDEGLGITG
tara:strand:- start:234 stop:506 length:273 start_codon:yes stop_codon:yes gene_type:complete